MSLTSRARGWSLIGASGLLSVCLSCESAPSEQPVTVVDRYALRAKVSACLGLNGGQSVAFFWPPAFGGEDAGRPAADCVARAATCSDVLNCAGYSDEPCEADRCEDSEAVHCVPLGNGRRVARRDPCLRSSTGNSSCSVVDDLKEGRIAFCHGNECAEDHCDGNVKVICRDGLSMRQDCASDAGICLEYGGLAFCATQQPCVMDHCEGNTLTLCHAGVVELAQPCDALVPGSECVSLAGAVECRARVSDPGCSDHADFASWCEGSTNWVCIAGIRLEVACSAMPQGMCVAQTENVGGGNDRAYCTTSSAPF